MPPTQDLRDRINQVRARSRVTQTGDHPNAARLVSIHNQITALSRKRDLNADDEREFDRLSREFSDLDRSGIEAMLATGDLRFEHGSIGDDDVPPYIGTGRDQAGPEWVRTSDHKPATVARGKRWADHEIVREFASANTERERPVVGQHGSFGGLVRSMTTTSGSAVVPTVWAGEIIDRARNLSAVLQAGAALLPMDAKTVQIGRLTADPTAAFRTEGSTVTASDPTFDNVVLDAKTMSALVVGSLEWFMDADNVDAVVRNAIAQAIATQLDYVSLFGGVVAGGEGINLATPPNPRGVLATLLAVAASSVIGSGANGTAQTAATYWREVQSAVFLPQTFNEQPNAILWNAKLLQQYVDAYDTTNQPLQMPANVAAMERYVTNQIPSFTQGTMTSRCTDLFVGDWRQLLIGQRLSLYVQTLVERYAENGQIGIVAHWRGDVAPARPRAFSVFRYLQGAL
jgi:HK97 family phage major capsid protein